MQQRTCALAATDGPCGKVYGKGWCRKHHARWERTGDPLTIRKRGKGALLAELHTAAKATTDQCIILTTPKGRRPMGQVDGKLMYASRCVWVIANGDPGDQHVLHTCHRGEEGCINIRHLYLGDNDRNIADMVEAGRSTRGERSGMHKLKAHQVHDIRRRIEAREPYSSIAARYGVSASLVSQIRSGKVWGWLPDDQQ